MCGQGISIGSDVADTTLNITPYWIGKEASLPNAHSSYGTDKHLFVPPRKQRLIC